MRVGLVARDKFISFYEMSCEMRNKDRMSTQFFEMGRGLYGAIVIWGFLRVPICTKKNQCVLKIKYPPPQSKKVHTRVKCTDLQSTSWTDNLLPPYPNMGSVMLLIKQRKEMFPKRNCIIILAWNPFFFTVRKRFCLKCF